MQPNNWKQDWTTVGTTYVQTDEDRIEFVREVGKLKWELPVGDGPMGPVMAINEAIKQIRIPNVQAVAMNGGFANLGVYGIRAWYKEGLVEAFILDTGVECTPVMTRIDKTKPQPKRKAVLGL